MEACTGYGRSWSTGFVHQVFWAMTGWCRRSGWCRGTCFCPPERAYRDEAVVTKWAPDGRSISSSSQPAVMAVMLEQLDVGCGQRVLEIGAGTGYNAALLAHLVGEVGEVTTVDIDEDLVEQARQNLAAVGVRGVSVVCADGAAGWPGGAPTTGSS